jgi:hypothetical protein
MLGYETSGVKTYQNDSADNKNVIPYRESSCNRIIVQWIVAIAAKQRAPLFRAGNAIWLRGGDFRLRKLVDVCVEDLLQVLPDEAPEPSSNR